MYKIKGKKIKKDKIKQLEIAVKEDIEWGLYSRKDKNKNPYKVYFP